MSIKCYRIVIFILSVTFTRQQATETDEVYFGNLIDFLYEKYPDFIPRLLAYNGSMFDSKRTVLPSNVYSGGYVLQTKHAHGYNVYLANAFQQKQRNGLTMSSAHVSNVMYKCRSAIHYCSGNPAYCKYHEGDKGTKIIITAGHDGPIRPKSIPDREVGCWDPALSICIYKHNCENRKKGVFKDYQRCSTKDEDDVETTDMAEVVADTITRLTGKRPHLIVNRVHRVKMDVNREIGLGTFYVPEAMQAYKDFHNFIRRAKQSFDGEWGILLDMHGNNRGGDWTMLGYGMYKYQFDYKILRANTSSLRVLADHVKVSFDALVRGNNSLGHFMDEQGIRVFPSPKNPSPLEKGYLTGGYITTYHGSKHGGNIDAVQIEMPSSVRDDAKEEVQYLSALSQAVVKYIDFNYGMGGKISIEKTKET